MPMFIRAEMNMHILKSGKHIDKSCSVLTSMRKAKTFLGDEYLNNLSSTSDQVHFSFKGRGDAIYPQPVMEISVKNNKA